MSRVRILDPTAAPPEVDAHPGPDAGSLAGKVVGLRSDTAWESYGWVLDEWAPRLRALGADVRRWRAGNRIGDEGVVTSRELADFASAADVAVVGLGN
ncbi:MAG: hypothetical protein FJW88_07275 [Actinobacteria bacterium]|nr:hypothetical protein [Actinomycetota bacterium]